jgi:multisubunit Na+/H+ antiporter MnhB subunit
VRLADSRIVQTILARLLPLVLIFGAAIASYGAVLPGGGFQAGVLVGTLLVVIELSLEQELRSEIFFERLELLGLLIVFSVLFFSFVITGLPSAGIWGARLPSLPLGNLVFWLLSMGIFLEVSASMVLVFRHFVFTEKSTVFNNAQQLKTGKPEVQFRHGLVLAIVFSLLFVYYVLFQAKDFVIMHRHEDWHTLTQSLGIRNMVSTVYLGPRLVDTLNEVLVVTLTVMGIRVLAKLDTERSDVRSKQRGFHA